MSGPLQSQRSWRSWVQGTTLKLSTDHAAVDAAVEPETSENFELIQQIFSGIFVWASSVLLRYGARFLTWCDVLCCGFSSQYEPEVCRGLGNKLDQGPVRFANPSRNDRPRATQIANLLIGGLQWIDPDRPKCVVCTNPLEPDITQIEQRPVWNHPHQLDA